eukprot:TRINITY_DN2393_c0_g1_i2.p1 TRINITY_DN2393_c0_g1~~TRINITY_DN2393_c0_g1_i2.p1  ORF type:complete len:241 (-),score=64.81 TRINITY_DN2393_c0_g1_i2:82-759(-)
MCIRDRYMGIKRGHKKAREQMRCGKINPNRMFWGRIVTESKPYQFPADSKNQLLYISNAALSPSSSQGRTYLMITVKGKTFTVGYLQKDEMEMVSLDLYLHSKQNAKITVVGKGEVHFTGSLENTSVGEDLDEELVKDFEEDEEDIEMLPPTKPKTNNTGKGNKKLSDEEESLDEEDMQEVNLIGDSEEEMEELQEKPSKPIQSLKQSQTKKDKKKNKKLHKKGK